MRINNNLKLFIYLFFLSFSLLSANKDTYLSNYIMFGYDSNVSKFSSSENLDFNDSFYLTFKPSIKKSVNFFKNKNRKTKISFSGKMSYYIDVEKKSNEGYYLNISQSIGNYQKLKFYHAYLSDIYIREYADLDLLVSDNLYTGSDCYFDLIKYKISYESPYLGEKDKIEISIYNELQYYSSEFTEYDLDIMGIEGKFFTKRSDNRYSFQFGYAQADTLYSHIPYLLSDDFAGNTLRLVDRSYEENSIKISYDMPFLNDNVLGFSVAKKQRKYLSNNDYIVNGVTIVDQLHKDRKHREFYLNIWLAFNNQNRKNKIQLSYRQKDTISPYSWVQDLKSFSKFNLEYIVYFNKIKIG